LIFEKFVDLADAILGKFPNCYRNALHQICCAGLDQ
jgi:hypothetical protein